MRIKLVVAAAVALAAIATQSAQAATKPPAVLAQGAGMGAKPSPAVRHVQRVLRSQGYGLGRPGVDGRFGPLTAAAVRRLQNDYGLTVDGIVGPKTRKLMRLAERRATKRPASAPSKSNQPHRTNQPRPATPKPVPAAPAPAPRKAAGSNSGSNTAGWLFAIAIVAAIAAFCTALVTGYRRRRQPADTGRAAVAPLGYQLYVEGHSADERVADFRGHAFAATLTEEEPAGEPAQSRTWYLVDDTRKPRPVWVNGDEIRRSPSRLAAGDTVIGYVVVEAEGRRGEAEAAMQEIERACDGAGWELMEVVTDRENGRGLDRPGLTYALEQIAEGKASGLVVNELRRVTRSITDLAALVEWFREAQAALVALDLGIDTSTPAGNEVAATLITLGYWERERIAQRTRSGLADVRASGGATGRPAVSDRPGLVERITAMRNANMTLQAIADQLNAEGVPTLRGGAMWRPSSVQAALGYRRPGTRTPLDRLPTLEDRA